MFLPMNIHWHILIAEYPNYILLLNSTYFFTHTHSPFFLIVLHVAKQHAKRRKWPDTAIFLIFKITVILWKLGILRQYVLILQPIYIKFNCLQGPSVLYKQRNRVSCPPANLSEYPKIKAGCGIFQVNRPNANFFYLDILSLPGLHLYRQAILSCW